MGRKQINIKGRKFGHLLALGESEVKGKNGANLWKFRCDCGRECLKVKGNVVQGTTKTCSDKDCKYFKELKPNTQKEVDITNERYGHLIAICRTEVMDVSRHYFWKFRCDCGRECLKYRSNVTNGDTKSCGHRDCKYFKELKLNAKKGVDITNERYGYLTAVCKTDKKDNYGHYFWKFRCDCGRECLKPKSNVIRGITKSCGNPECKYRHYRIRVEKR